MPQPGQLGAQFGGEDWILRKLADFERALREYGPANILATAGINVIPDGVIVNGLMQFKRPDGTVGVSVDPATGTFVAYNAAGTSPVARFGTLIETAPTEYGVEVLVGSTWVRLGNQTTTWASVSGKPSVFPPDAHTHAGGEITSAVANATNATEATHAAQADGSEYGWTNNVAGSSFYALWVGNDGGFHFGRNVSSARYKENVVTRTIDPAGVLALRPVQYDRKPTFRYPMDAQGNRLIGPAQRFEGAKNEFGLIAEEVEQTLPEIVTRYNGVIDGVRYDLLGVALLPVVQALQEQNDKLTALARAHGWDI
jgi:hypothetical protein